MTRAVTDPRAGYSVILPGTWAVVPMDDGEALKKRVAALIRNQMPSGDREARARKLIRDEMVSTAMQAKEAGASTFAIALEILPGIPFGASMIGFRQQWPPTQDEATLTPAGRLKRAVPDGTLLELAPGPVVRRESLEPQKVGETTISSLELEYWMIDDRGELVVFLVSVPMCEHVELFTEFFDAAVDSVRWVGRPVPGSELPVTVV